MSSPCTAAALCYFAYVQLLWWRGKPLVMVQVICFCGGWLLDSLIGFLFFIVGICLAGNWRVSMLSESVNSCLWLCPTCLPPVSCLCLWLRRPKTNTRTHSLKKQAEFNAQKSKETGSVCTHAEVGNVHARVLRLHVMSGCVQRQTTAGTKIWECLNYALLLLRADFLEKEI